MDEADYAQRNEEFFRDAALKAHFGARHTPVDDAAVASRPGTDLPSVPGPLPYGGARQVACRDCGITIPARRLEVYPAAERCIGCQSRVESRR